MSARRLILPAALLAAWSVCPLGGLVHADEAVTSQALTTRAWKSLGTGDLEDALEATATCRELFAAEATSQQAALEDFLPPEKGHDAWALNDVGTCLFIEGQVHEKAGRTAAAVTAYRRLVDDYRFAQCWDEKGWFWKPSQAAADRLEVLEFDEALAP